MRKSLLFKFKVSTNPSKLYSLAFTFFSCEEKDYE